MSYWEVVRVARGYRKKDRLTHQLLAECVYAITYSMRNPEGKTVKDMFPSLFSDDSDSPPVTKDDINEMRQLIRTVRKGCT